MPFPADNYTPHGYLDLPGHTRNLRPQGVLRSHGIGFRWHVPAYAASYGGRRETYRAGLRLSLAGSLEPAARCPYHTKNLVRLELEAGAARGSAEFHAVGPDALRATVEVRGSGRVRLGAHLEYTRLVSAGGEWGESGLVGRLDGDLLALQSFEDGDAFALWASLPPADAGVAPDRAEADGWAAHPASLPAAGFANALGARGDTVALFGALGFELDLDAGPVSLELVLARGRTLPRARGALAAARREAGPERARLLAEDEVFWERAPRLEGDWPEHWRRGLVYDLETLRMMVKAPVGVYRHLWDAMQIQAPRVVLAETAIDALLLGYADPEAAQAMLLGTLLDADAPNVPCSREDGSYNMVAADGTVCGTAPQWGYPFLVAEVLFAVRPDRAWLEAIHDRLAEHLGWWLAHRRDADGWLHFACSWESGQDDSPRFGDQPLGGGHPVRHVRPVDLHAAVAHAGRVLAGFARELGRPEDAERWDAVERRFAALTDGLWAGARYGDVDVGDGRFTDVDDTMLLAPYALGVAREERLAAGRELLERHDPQGHEWPMGAWTAVDAAARLGLREKAALMAHNVAERAYGFWDAREALPDRTLPGVACEYWPASGRCGGEGYGWGAFSVHLVLRTLLGYAPTPAGLRLEPNLPGAWREPGRRYRVRMTHHGRPLLVELEALAGGRVRVGLNGLARELAWGEALELDDGGWLGLADRGIPA